MALVRYYWKQMMHAIKENIGLILIIATSISLFNTRAFLFNGTVSALYSEMTAMYGEFGENAMVFEKSIPLEIPEGVPNAEAELRGRFQKSNLKVEEVSSFISLIYQNSYLFHDGPISEEFQTLAPELIEKNPIRGFPHFRFTNASTYASPRIQDRLKLFAGNYPTNQNQIMIPFEYSVFFNLSVGASFNLTLKTQLLWLSGGDNGENDIEIDFSIPGLTISGIYTENSQLDRQSIFEQYRFDSQVELTSPLYTYYNFNQSREENNHIAIELIEVIKDNELGGDRSSEYYMEQNNFDMDITINIEFKESFIDLRRPLTSMDQLQELEKDVKNIIPANYRIIIPMKFVWSDFIHFYFLFHMMFLIINLPIFLGMVSIGLIVARIIRKRQISEFILLRMKGFGKSQIRNQLLWEISVTSILAYILSLGMGYVLFLLARNSFVEIMKIIISSEVPNFYISRNPQIFLFDSIINVFPAILLGFVIHIPIFRLNYKSTLPELVKFRDERDLPEIYDEITVFEHKKDQKYINWDNYLDTDKNFKEKINITQKAVSFSTSSGMSEEPNLNDNLSKTKSVHKKGLKQVYQNYVKRFEDKIPKLGVVSILIGIIPLGLMYLYLGLQNVLKTSNFSGSSNLLRIIFEYEILFRIGVGFLSPFFIIIGIIRLIGVEHPAWFAKISKLLAKPIVGNFNKITSLKIIGSKELIKWIKIFTIFTTFITSFNILFNTALNYELQIANTPVGADLQIITPMFIDQNPTEVYQQINQLNQDLRNMKNNQNDQLVNDLIDAYYIEVNCQNIPKSPESLIGISIDIPKYKRIIQEGDKKLINNQIISNLETLEMYDRNPYNSTLPGVLVSEAIMNLIDPKDEQISLKINYFNSENQIRMNETFNFEILGMIGVLPGLTLNYEDQALLDQLANQNEYFILFNNLSNSFPDIKLNPFLRVSLLDLNKKEILNNNQTQFLIQSIADDQLVESDFKFYKYNRSELTNLDDFLYIYFQIGDILIFFVATILALNLGSILTSIRKSDDRFYALLYTRGYGKSGIFRIIGAQLFVMFTIGLVLGTIMGTIFPTLYLSQMTNEYSFYLQDLFRIYNNSIFIEPMLRINFLQLILIVSIIFLGAIGVLIFQTFSKNRHISEKLQKF